MCIAVRKQSKISIDSVPKVGGQILVIHVNIMYRHAKVSHVHSDYIRSVPFFQQVTEICPVIEAK